ncbi:MAG: hypothetical protein KDC38_11990 [Planctomycetes bacterium]|nr:hypothetical protein [Planctomycetota bacterium]
MEDPKNGRLSTDAELVRSIRRTRDRNGFRVGLAGGAVALLALVSTVRAQPGVGFGIYPAVGPYTEPLVARVGLSSYSPDLWSGWAFDLVHDPAATLDSVVPSATLLQLPLDVSIIDVQSWGFSVEAMHSVTIFPSIPPGEDHLYEATYSVTEPADVPLEFVEAVIFFPSGGSWSPQAVQRTIRFLPPFLRGDANRDGTVDLADFFRQFAMIGIGSTPDPHCDDAVDFNDDGVLSIADMWETLAFLFSGGAAPPPPYPDCGFDTTDPDSECADWACP